MPVLFVENFHKLFDSPFEGTVFGDDDDPQGYPPDGDNIEIVVTNAYTPPVGNAIEIII